MTDEQEQTDEADYLPVAVGSLSMQKRFIDRNKAFFLEYRNLRDVIKKTFLRGLQLPEAAEKEPLLGLADDDPEVIAFEDNVIAEIATFYLGRMAIDDFGEIIALSGNGHGFGALKILRGMYERIVTAMYLVKHPSEARSFANDSSIMKLKILNRMKAIPELKDRVTEDLFEKVDKNATAVRSKQKQSFCSKCGQPKTQEAWTRVSLDVMAKEVDPFLGLYYHEFYLEGTAQSHANSYGLERRLIRDDVAGKTTYKETSEDEAQAAFFLGHNLIVRLLVVLNDFHKLGFDTEVQEIIAAFEKSWAKNKPALKPPVEEGG
jgi:Family of unknown function (DUF5677)